METDAPKLVLAWRAGDVLLAIPSAAVLEVLPPVPWLHVPTTPSWVRGLFVHRGVAAALLDPRTLLELPAEEDRMANRVLVVEIAGADEGSRLRVGLWATAVLDLVRIDFTSTQAHHGFETAGGHMLGPLGPTPWGLAQLVRTDELLSPEQRSVLVDRLRERAA